LNIARALRSKKYWLAIYQPRYCVKRSSATVSDILLVEIPAFPAGIFGTRLI
jgi:hypothetical protein